MKATDWLASVRKLDPVLLEAMGIRDVSHPKIGAAVAFPYRRKGEPYAAKFRTVEKQFRSTEGVTRGVYNEDALRENETQPIIITEGEIDCLSVIQSGFSRAISVPDGWTEKGNKTDALIAVEEYLKRSPYVVVAGDNDKSGESLPRAVANLLYGHDVRFVTWPDGCKDANDVLSEFGEGEVAACINAAQKMDPPGGRITAISDLPPMSDRRVLRTGTKPFDYVVAFELGAMSVGTGTPGSGKSTFTTWAAEMVSRNENIRVGMLAFETHPYVIRDHISLINTGRAWDELSERQQAEVGFELNQRWRIVHRTDDVDSHNLAWLQDMIFTLAVREQCKLIVIDPWNEVEHLPEPGESMTAYINFALKKLRQWAEQLEIHICMIAHPRKMNTEGKPRPATGYDVADSAAFANKPSLGFTVFPTEDDEGMAVVDIHTWKVRDTLFYGFERGKIRVQFQYKTKTYIPL